MKKFTSFASARRATEKRINADFDDLNNNEYIKMVINALPEVVAILNKERQIVFGNDSIIEIIRNY